MRELRYLDSAIDDLDAIAEYIARDGEGLAFAIGFIGKLQQRCERIASLPGTLGTARPELRPGMRSVPQDGYVILFRYSDDDAVEIVNVLNCRMDFLAHYRPDDE